MTYLCGRAKVVSKVDANHPTTLQVHHEVGEMPVPYPEDVLAHGEGGQRAQAVGAQDEECLGRGG